MFRTKRITVQLIIRSVVKLFNLANILKRWSGIYINDGRLALTHNKKFLKNSMDLFHIVEEGVTFRWLHAQLIRPGHTASKTI